MVKFKEQTIKDIAFIESYIHASNAATGSKFDSNANVEQKNIATMGNELHKGKNIEDNRMIIYRHLDKLYGEKIALSYLSELENHRKYKHDETATPGMPYCVAIAMYTFANEGLKSLGGQSDAPTDLKSFCGGFINLVYTISGHFAGAVATPEFLLYMDYYIRLDYGDNYLTKLNDVVELNRKGRTLEKVIENCFQQVVHSINTPAGGRSGQAVFWNISYFDKNYFDGVFSEFEFPDNSKPKWETLSWLQKKFMKWFNKEREKYVLTFPVETMALLSDGEDIVDKEYADFAAEMYSEGHSYFTYISDSADSLSSCCRLRNSLKDMNDVEHNHNTHQYSMGTASVATGSKSVITMNLNRTIQDAVRRYSSEKLGYMLTAGQKFDKSITKEQRQAMYEYIRGEIADSTEQIHKYHIAFDEELKEMLNNHMLPTYDACYIHQNKQYYTVGVNGLTDAAEFLNIDANLNDDYIEFTNLILETINKVNKKNRTRKIMFNTEFVPGENLSVKNYDWDKADGYYVSPKHNAYSSYFFNPEDESLSVIDKMKLHGEKFVKYLDGGSACHINLAEHLTKEQYRVLLKVAVKNGTNYFTFNVRNTLCLDCGYISKHTLDKCPKCGSTHIDYLTRIIGYLKRMGAWAEARQKEGERRAYNN